MKSSLNLPLSTLFFSAFFILSAGCTTVTRGTKDVLVIESDPAGADIELSNGLTGKTPASFKLPRKDAVVVKIKKEGYETVEVNVQPQVVGAGAAGMAGNVVLGGLVGAAVDAGTGAMKDLKPNPVKVNLVPLGTPPVQPVQEIQPAPAVPSISNRPQKTVAERLAALNELFEADLIDSREYRERRKAIIEDL